MVGWASTGVAEAPRRWRATDPEVVSAARAGCSASFESIYGSLSGRVRRAAQRVLREEHDVEDAVQDTFLAVLEGICELNDPRAFDGWVLRIARFKAISMARRQERISPSSAVHGDRNELGTGGDGVARRWGAVEPEPVSLTVLRSALGQLPVSVQETLRLKYRVGLSCQAIARAHGVSLSCVKTRLHRGRRDLYRALDRDGG